MKCLLVVDKICAQKNKLYLEVSALKLIEEFCKIEKLS